MRKCIEPTWTTNKGLSFVAQASIEIAAAIAVRNHRLNPKIIAKQAFDVAVALENMFLQDQETK